MVLVILYKKTNFGRPSENISVKRKKLLTVFSIVGFIISSQKNNEYLIILSIVMIFFIIRTLPVFNDF